jgi:hypothetical protein
MEISSRRLRISGRTAGPVVFAKFGDPRSIGRASFGGSKIFAFAYRRRVPMTGCRPLDPFAASVVGGVDRGPSATHLLGWLSALRSLSPAVGTPAPIASCGGRACNDGLLPLFLRPEILNFCGRGARPGPPPRRFDVGRLPRRPFAIPVRGRRRARFPRRSAAIFRPIFAFCGGPGNAFRPLGDVRGRSRRRRSIGRPRLSMGLPLTRNASGAPFSRYRARKVRKATFSRIELLRTTGPDRLSHRSFGARHPGSL